MFCRLFIFLETLLVKEHRWCLQRTFNLYKIIVWSRSSFSVPCKGDLECFVASNERSKTRQTLLPRAPNTDKKGVASRSANNAGHLKIKTGAFNSLTKQTYHVLKLTCRRLEEERPLNCPAILLRLTLLKYLVTGVSFIIYFQTYKPKMYCIPVVTSKVF